MALLVIGCRWCSLFFYGVFAVLPVLLITRGTRGRTSRCARRVQLDLMARRAAGVGPAAGTELTYEVIAVQPQAGRLLAIRRVMATARCTATGIAVALAQRSPSGAACSTYLAPYRYLGATRSASSVEMLCGANLCFLPEPGWAGAGV